MGLQAALYYLQIIVDWVTKHSKVFLDQHLVHCYCVFKIIVIDCQLVILENTTKQNKGIKLDEIISNDMS